MTAILSIGWSGQWTATFTRKHDAIELTTGVENATFILHAGESVRTTSILILSYHDGQIAAANRFRRLIRSELSPIGKGDVPPVPPMAFECFGGMSTESMKKRINALTSHGIRFDYLWIDKPYFLFLFD